MEEACRSAYLRQPHADTSKYSLAGCASDRDYDYSAISIITEICEVCHIEMMYHNM